MEPIEYVYTAGMTESEVDERLREESAGVLALAREGRSYAVPVSHHYDGGSLYFRLGDDAHSEKLAFAEATEEACFVLFGVEPPDESWSVLARGPLRRLSDEAAEAFDAAALNERFGPLRVFDERLEDVDLVPYELRIETLTGRRTTE